METNNWISVKNKLPHHFEVVMIPCDDNPLGMKMAQFMEHGISKEMKDEKNYFCKADEYGFDDKYAYFEVKAWLPLPKPSKELFPHKTRRIDYLDLSDNINIDNKNNSNDEFEYPEDKFQITIGNTTFKPYKYYEA